jgi:hypothetical protein
MYTAPVRYQLSLLHLAIWGNRPNVLQQAVVFVQQSDAWGFETPGLEEGEELTASTSIIAVLTLH